jgi:hypothetical protein
MAPTLANHVNEFLRGYSRVATPAEEAEMRRVVPSPSREDRHQRRQLRRRSRAGHLTPRLKSWLAAYAVAYPRPNHAHRARMDRLRSVAEHGVLSDDTRGWLSMDYIAITIDLHSKGVRGNPSFEAVCSVLLTDVYGREVHPLRPHWSEAGRAKTKELVLRWANARYEK